jgi:hypothetical protein
MTVLCALILALGAGGCLGGDDDDSGHADDVKQIKEKGAEFEAAIEADDAEAFCELLAPSFIKQIGGQEACVKQYNPKTNLFFTADDTDMAVKEVDFENDTHATALLANDGFVYYLFEDGEWYPTPTTR